MFPLFRDMNLFQYIEGNLKWKLQVQTRTKNWRFDNILTWCSCADVFAERDV